MAIEAVDVEKFMTLFQGNERSFGQFTPTAKTKMITVKSTFTREHVRSHLEGEIGLGVVPIRDDDKCTFAAIDIDVHGPNGRQVDLIEIERKVTRQNLPLVVCRSKSGGAHCYLFLKEPTDAARVRAMMVRWAAALGYGSSEVFPKQVTLNPPKSDAERPLGNWINLPYYHAEETDRWAIDGGKQVTLEYFLALAEGRRVDLIEYERGSDIDYINGPPCLQAMIEQKIDEGSRNNAVFQAAVFLKRAYPEDWRQRLEQFNVMALGTPLATRELRQVGGSVAKKEYQYKCREDPCRSLCNKEVCRKREFGITDNDARANEIPAIDKVEKVVATPIRWALTVAGQVVEVTTPELFNYEAVRQRVGEKLHIVLPRIKNQEWDQYLREIMTKVEVREEMTLEDMIFQRLCEFLRRVRKDKERPEIERRDDLKRGMPALISISVPWFDGQGGYTTKGTQWFYAFKLTDFLDYLRRRKVNLCADHQMSGYLHKILGEDARRDKMRMKNSRISNVWCVAEEFVEDEEVPAKRFDMEF